MPNWIFSLFSRKYFFCLWLYSFRVRVRVKEFEITVQKSIIVVQWVSKKLIFLWRNLWTSPYLHQQRLKCCLPLRCTFAGSIPLFVDGFDSLWSLQRFLLVARVFGQMSADDVHGHHHGFVTVELHQELTMVLLKDNLTFSLHFLSYFLCCQ